MITYIKLFEDISNTIDARMAENLTIAPGVVAGENHMKPQPSQPVSQPATMPNYSNSSIDIDKRMAENLT